VAVFVVEAVNSCYRDSSRSLVAVAERIELLTV